MVGVPKASSRYSRGQGFTMVEILVVMGIILTLAAVAVPVSKACIDKARAAREVSGARHAVAAWLRYSGENDGRVLVGYAENGDPELLNARNTKNQLPSPITIARRYVFRLAPYLDYDLKGSLLVNKQTTLTEDYAISTMPSFGINGTYLGGDYSSGSDFIPTSADLDAQGKLVVSRLVELHSPTKMIVFGSARFKDGGVQREGYNMIRAPYQNSRVWPAAYDEAGAADQFGFIHLRFSDRAVCAMADGHVELLGYEQLEDMRRWSNLAAQADDPNWTFQASN